MLPLQMQSYSYFPTMRHCEIPKKCRLACERDTYADTYIIGLAFRYVWISLGLKPDQYIPCSHKVTVVNKIKRMFAYVDLLHLGYSVFPFRLCSPLSRYVLLIP